MLGGFQEMIHVKPPEHQEGTVDVKPVQEEIHLSHYQMLSMMESQDQEKTVQQWNTW